jgi:predicted DsbA family dithiol-disulfide isomerase
MPELAVDIVSDVVCPWCFIGIRRMEQALAAFPEVTPRFTIHPFLLDPKTPEAGVDLREHLRRKYRVDPEPMFARVEAAAKESGIELDFAKVRRSVPTVRAHALICRAEERGTQHALAMALLGAYFLEGRDVSDVEVLVEIAAAHGFTAEEARKIATTEAELAETRADAAEIVEQGVSGVPYFVLGKRLAFSGAQPVEKMKEAIAKALQG